MTFTILQLTSLIASLAPSTAPARCLVARTAPAMPAMVRLGRGGGERERERESRCGGDLSRALSLPAVPRRMEVTGSDLTRCLGWGLGRNLRRVVDVRRWQETAEDGGSLCRSVCVERLQTSRRH